MCCLDEKSVLAESLPRSCQCLTKCLGPLQVVPWSAQLYGVRHCLNGILGLVSWTIGTQSSAALSLGPAGYCPSGMSLHGLGVELRGQKGMNRASGMRSCLMFPCCLE